MKLNINLQEDAELRKEIKKVFLGQVKNLTREEIGDTIRREFEKAVGGLFADDKVLRIVKNAAEIKAGEMVKDLFWQEFVTGTNFSKYLKEVIDARIKGCMDALGKSPEELIKASVAECVAKLSKK